MNDWQFGILFIMMLTNLLKDVIDREHKYHLEKRKQKEELGRKLSLSALQDPTLQGIDGILIDELEKTGKDIAPDEPKQ